MTYDYHGIDAEESTLTKSLPNLETWALPNLFFIINTIGIPKICRKSLTVREIFVLFLGMYMH